MDEKEKQLLATIVDLFTGADGGVGFVMFRERYNDLCQQARAGEESAIQLVAVVRRFALLTKVLSRTTNGANL